MLLATTQPTVRSMGLGEWVGWMEKIAQFPRRNRRTYERKSAQTPSRISKILFKTNVLTIGLTMEGILQQIHT